MSDTPTAGEAREALAPTDHSGEDVDLVDEVAAIIYKGITHETEFGDGADMDHTQCKPWMDVAREVLTALRSRLSSPTGDGELNTKRLDWLEKGKVDRVPRWRVHVEEDGTVNLGHCIRGVGYPTLREAIDAVLTGEQEGSVNKTYEPEIGQAVFGAPWQRLEAPRWLSEMLADLGDEIDDHHGVNPMSNSGASFANDTFESRAYYWGEDEELEDLPNFKYGDFEVSWYKHCLRGCSMNRAITQEEASAMIDACKRSLTDV
jgi:hypothetical protein